MTRTVVVGAGAIGLACAHDLVRRGESVVVLDRGPAGRGCSAGNAGWITPSISEPIPAPGLVWTSLRWMASRDSPLYIAPSALPGLTPWLWRFWRHCNPRDYLAGFRAVAALGRLARPLFDELAVDGLPIELHRKGLLFVFLDPAAMEKARANFGLVDDGYDVPDVLDGTALRDLEPSLSDAVTSGFYVREEYHVRPETLTRAYAECINRLGGEVREGVEVVGPAHANGRLVGVETSNGTVGADRVLLAAGAWTGRLGQAFGLRLPVQAGKGYSVTLDSAAPFERPLYLGDVKVGATPFAAGHRFAGTMELSGINERLDRRRLAGIRRAIGRYFTRPPVEGGAEWVGMRPLTPDGLPALGRAPHRDNLFVATGHAMLGITLAPATGRVMADLMTGRPEQVSQAPFAPGRFSW